MNSPVSDNAPVGVVTCCYEADYAFVKATCASVRHFLGDVPLCVIVDGDLNAEPLRQQYGAKLLHTREIEDREVRDVCHRSFFAKMTVFFADSLDRFLYLDSDAIVWGNPLRWLRLEEHDFCIFNPIELPCPRDAIEKYQFHIAEMERFDPDFRYEDYHFFCSGVFAARKTAITKDDLLSVLELQRSRPNLFSFYGEMPLLNYLVFSKVKRGELTYHVEDRQFFPTHYDIAAMSHRFGPSPSRLRLDEASNEDLVLHFSGRKPRLFNRSIYQAPFTFFRLRHHRAQFESSRRAWAHVAAEDARVWAAKAKQKSIRTVKRLVGQ